MGAADRTYAVFFAEHTHIPVVGENAWPEGSDGGPLPRKYWHCYDLFVALTAAAAATSTLRVGSGICLVVERDPIITANEVASVDQLSGGRFEFGAGAGWNRQEMRHHGTKPRQRMKLLREPVEAAPDGSSTPMRPTGRAGRLPETRHQPICD